MFQSLGDRLQDVFKKLRGRGRLSEADVDQALREVRLALLEADVNFKVVKDFVGRLRKRAVGEEVLGSLSPGQQVVKIVHEELTELMGGGQAALAATGSPTVMMLVGLQGSGKTTTTGKLARYLMKQGRRPLLVAADTQRPAAVEQLRQLGSRLEVPVFGPGGIEAGTADSKPGQDPVRVARDGIREAARAGRDVVLVDTAGRLQIDDALMEQLAGIRDAAQPHEILLVVDAMTGQEAVSVAESFHQTIQLTGIVLTKLDGDTRGGAALSVRAVTGCPVKLIGTGEHPEALETFHPERMASRILGMGDVLTLIERAQSEVDADQARRMEEKLRQDQFTLEDFLDQLKEMRKLGPLDQILDMLPGAGQMKELKNMKVDEQQLGRVEAVIHSMTPGERRDPKVINASRRRRIAAGSGTTVQEVNRVLKQFNQTRDMVRQLTGNTRGKGGKKARRAQKALQGLGGLQNPFFRP